MSVLVTGAAGFVGASLVRALLNQGNRVRALDLPTNPAFQQLQRELDAESGIEFVGADITDPAAVASAMSGCVMVFHVAALLNSIAPYDTFYRINVQGTENLCRAAVNANIERFVLVSTSDVFGLPQHPQQVLSEDSGYHPWGEPYADTKIKACQTVRRFHALHGLPFTIVYPGWVYGPGDRQFFPAIADTVKDGVMFLWHRTEPYAIDFVYIDDLVDGILKAAFSEQGRNDDFLLLDNSNDFTIADLARFLAQDQPRKLWMIRLPYRQLLFLAGVLMWLTRKGILKHHVISRTDVKAFGNAFRFTNQKARDKLGWTPATKLSDGLARYRAWQQGGQ